MTAEWLKRLGNVINCIVCYYTVNLGRSVFFSFLLVFVVVLLRKTPLFRNCFQRMILWSCFLWLPFMGGLKLFYETRFGIRGFFWWAGWNYTHFATGWFYFLVMAVYGGYLFYRGRKLLRAVKKMERFRKNVFLCEDVVTPFAVGVFSPKIVVPRVMVEEYGKEDLETILFHEKIHIRLGHLWCLFLWDVLRVLLWPNFFMIPCMKLLKADLEEMCDRVTIQEGGKSACDYGMLLLQCVRLLCFFQSEKLLTQSAAFVGEVGKNGYQEMKRRIQKIAGFQRYRMRNIVFILIIGLLMVGCGFLEIHRYSYARYTELEDITVLDDTGTHVIMEDSERLRQAVTFDKEIVTVKVDEMQEMLEECGSSTEGIYILFGGFMKQPGVGGGGNMVYMDVSQLAGDKLEMEYDNHMDVLTWIVKNM